MIKNRSPNKDSWFFFLRERYNSYSESDNHYQKGGIYYVRNVTGSYGRAGA